MSNRVSQADIAEHAGVSASTVSRALHNDPRISEAVRRKILDAAQELGYRPDPAVSALANYRWKSNSHDYSGTIAWITVGQTPKDLREEFPEFELYWKGANQCAHRFGYQIEEYALNKSMPLEKLEKILYARNVTGLLLPPETQSFPGWDKLHAANYSVVRMSRSVHNLEAHLVTTNQTADGFLAAAKMNQLGYRRIGFVGYTHPERFFYPGFSWGQHNHPEAEFIPPLFLNQIPTEQHVSALTDWIKTYKPDAILEDCPGFYELLEKTGIRIPEDIAVATQNALPNPGTAGILQNLKEVGRVSMLLLMSLIHDHDRGIPEIARQVLVKGKWVDGASMPPRGLE